MSDLYNQDTYTLDELRKKHDGFATPCCIIKVGGKNITEDLGYYFDSVSVTQTIKAKSGTCRFSIINAYEPKSSSFKSDLDSSFSLGEKVEVSLGYKKPVIVFKGFIGDVSLSFNEGASPKVGISCFDVRMLMMQGRQNAALEKAKFDSIADKLFEYYKSFIEFKNDSKIKHNKEENFNQNGTDFDYINNYAKSRGLDFFVLGDKAYLQEVHACKEPLMTLEFSESLLSFSQNYSYNSVKVEGTLADYTKGDPITETAQAEKPTYKQKQLTSDPILIRIDASQVKNPEDLKTVVQAEAKKRERESKSGSARCIGLPELIPARFVKLSKLDKKLLDDKLFISEVTHEFSTSGYTTTLDFSSPTQQDPNGELASSSKTAKSQKTTFGATIKKVVDNKYDDENPACVKLDIAGQEGTTDWVRVASPFAGKEFGLYLMPEIGDEVVTMYCDGDINKPVVIAGLFSKQSKPPPDMFDEKNDKKCIKTKSGHLIQFIDTKDKTSMQLTSAKGFSINLNDEAQTLSLSDSKGENKITINEKDGEITISAKSKITLKADSATITLDGKAKSLKLNADTLEAKPSKTLNLNTQQIKIEGKQLSLKGQAVGVESSGQLEIKSTGVASLKGSMVKIN